jgi:hypothetical protein
VEHILLLELQAVILFGMLLHGLFAQGIGPINLVLLPMFGLLGPLSSIVLTNLLSMFFVTSLYLGYLLRAIYLNKSDGVSRVTFWKIQADRLLEGVLLFLGSLPGIALGILCFKFLVHNQEFLYFHLSIITWLKLFVVLMILFTIYYENFIQVDKNLAPLHSPLFTRNPLIPRKNSTSATMFVCLLVGFFSGFSITTIGISGVIELAYGLGYRKWSHQDCIFIPQVFLILTSGLIYSQYISSGIVNAINFPVIEDILVHHKTLIILSIPLMGLVIALAIFLREKMVKDSRQGKLYMDVSMVVLCYISVAKLFATVMILEGAIVLLAIYFISKLFQQVRFACP